MICEKCKNHITDDYVIIENVEICPDCYENLTVDELVKLLNLDVVERNLQEEIQSEIEDFKYRQERGK